MANAFSCIYSFKHIRAVNTLSVRVLKVVSLITDLVSSFLKKRCLQIANIKAFFYFPLYISLYTEQYYDTKIRVIKYIHVIMHNNTKLYFNVCTGNSYEICAVLFTNLLLKLLNLKQCSKWDQRLHSCCQIKKKHAFYAIGREDYFRVIHIIKLSFISCYSINIA